ncbi:MAG: exonuclease domain-containing protein [Blautia sp.]|nr:exonuclease domain-containing protein [Blautia sp.]
MNYIVLDLEWNQNPSPWQKPNKLMPYEIMEIGAVKLDEERNELDTFRALIRPNVYHQIQENIYQVTHVDYQELKNGCRFSEAARDFLSWCGKDVRFCTWAKQDLSVLQNNLQYYHLLSLLPGPLLYLDVQKLFSLCFEDGEVRRSLELACDILCLTRESGFHRALSDAIYTGEILRSLKEEYLTGYESLDITQHPKKGEPPYRLQSKGRMRLCTPEYPSLRKLLQNKELFSIACPVCERGDLLDRCQEKAEWFSQSLYTYQCSALCPEHGDLKGKIKIKTGLKGQYFGYKNLSLTSEEEGKRLALRRKELAASPTSSGSRPRNMP